MPGLTEIFAATNSGPLPTGFDAAVVATAVVATVVAAGVVAAVVATVVASVVSSVVAAVVGASPSPIIIVSGFESDVYL